MYLSLTCLSLCFFDYSHFGEACIIFEWTLSLSLFSHLSQYSFSKKLSCFNISPLPEILFYDGYGKNPQILCQSRTDLLMTDIFPQFWWPRWVKQKIEVLWSQPPLFLTLQSHQQITDSLNISFNSEILIDHFIKFCNTLILLWRNHFLF